MSLQILGRLALFVLFSSCYSSTPEDITDCVGSDVNIPWEYPDSAGINIVSWDYIDSSNVATTILAQAAGSAAKVIGDYNIQHNTNGDVTIIDATVANSGTYRITVLYTSATPTFTDDVVINVYDPPTDFNFTESPSGSQKTFTCITSSLGDPAADLYIQISGKDNTTSVSVTVSEKVSVKCFLSGPAVQCMSGVSGTVISLDAQIGKPSGSNTVTEIVTPLCVIGGGSGVVGGGGYLYYKLSFSKIVWFAFLTYNGIWILGASIGACVVKGVTHGGPADGKLKDGNQIHKIDGVSLTGKDQHEIEAMIKDKIKLILHVSKVGSLEISIVELNCKKGELLGFDCENLAMVTEVTERGKAYRKLKKGDRILSINGKSTTGKSIGDINKQLKIPPTVLDLSLKRGKEERNVTLDFKGKALSGIAIKKEKEDIVVSAIEPESAAESGDVKEQDCILSVNGVSTAGMKVGDIKDMLTFSIILKVTKDVTLKELDPDMDGSFGFETFPPSTSTSVAFNKQTTVTSVTPDRPANVVKSVTPNGPAARHGIKPGDTIVSINGKKTKGKSHQEIKAMLETFGTSISLKIAENDKPNQTNGHGGNDIEMGHVNPRAQDSGRVQTLETTEEKQDFMKPLLDDKC